MSKFQEELLDAITMNIADILDCNYEPAAELIDSKVHELISHAAYKYDDVLDLLDNDSLGG